MANNQNILQSTIEGLPIKVYPNARAVTEVLEVHSTNILKCCRGEIKQAYGYKWEFYVPRPQRIDPRLEEFRKETFASKVKKFFGL